MAKLLLLVVVVCFFIPLLSYDPPLAAASSPATNSPSPQLSFRFDFSDRSSYSIDDLRFEGNASVGDDGTVDLTCNESAQSIHNCLGRMSYAHPVKLYDSATGEVASFSARFTFAIVLVDDGNPMATKGDGLAFFLTGYQSLMPPTSGGGNLGLINVQNTVFGRERFVAVEFDTFNNSWDPNATLDHMGVDISSKQSVNTTSLPSYSLSGTMTASITFDNRTRMLVAHLEHPSFQQPAEVSTVLPDPTTTSLLPPEVSVGFSASTGGQGRELHQIHSWSFNSTLGPPPPQPPTTGKHNSAGKLLGIVLPIVFVVVVAAITVYMWNVHKRRTRATKLPHQTQTVEDFESIKSALLSLSSLQVATDNFNESNKLGEGGFGAVYKGELSGQEVAVKRLSKGSGQGLEELKNELVLVAKLHHKNLVRLEGFCLEEGERLLIYEYMPNKSLDTVLFDPEEKRRLDWRKRFNIIEGIARGLQYLHKDSLKKIVHRDLKASNILLDANMNPKIGDFGLARLFGQDQTRDVTNRVVGTFGYMSPEYVMRGQYSTKSDVFSFGILVIEIITGLRNTGHYFNDQSEDIISIVWRHWVEGKIVEMIDDCLGLNCSETEELKCVNIGLLCI